MAFPYYVSFFLNLAVWCVPLMKAGWGWRGCCIKRGPQWSIFNRAGKDVHQKEKHDLTSLITKDHNTGSLHEGTKLDWKLKLHLKWKSGKGEGGGSDCFMLEGGSNYNPELTSLWVRCDTTLWNRHKSNWFCNPYPEENEFEENEFLCLSQRERMTTNRVAWLSVRAWLGTLYSIWSVCRLSDYR